MVVRFFLPVMALALLVAPVSPVGAQIFDNRPDAVVCPVAEIAGRPGGDVVFHLVWQDDAGTTYYAPMGTLAFRLEIGADGVVQAAKLKGCDGQTVAQLRESGRAFFYR
ncbi:MAG: hypothetical protein QNJ06_13410 [Kiloniellales bacterium]|nr:hypothetical protein [Kiloniellales bacterium]MDJ0970887.1 hypothetical protein [Kiloniellales bacterium]MDJ0982699.1 hypothetical protein [Kiloniellales bacterium]